ncbi:hypothetical protein AGRA3207_007244 [Actinomadura graeca]|uniref:Trypsin-co-occurring domain-containing protein n=1 Tax=Actinomadura graeca TaxID=2750812 RepID=A0ABX8R3W0_9ACTN|nr:CU044_2847 family protein [Actinomadura graeca]QXJ25715.1 hypothetical protein AGRA3207_007244 [Actinomadura graeca]
MTELLRFETTGGGEVAVEVGELEPGVERVARGGQEALRRRFQEALAGVREAAADALDAFRSDRLGPDQIELEFGVRLNAEAGAVIAKTSTDGHLTVKLTWSSTPPQDSPR